MSSLRSIAVAIALIVPASVPAFELPPETVDLHGRVNAVVVMDDRGGTFDGDVSSRSPLARTRFMSSLDAGTDRFGRLFLKGSARWNDADGDGTVHFDFEQGSARWQYRGGAPHHLRAFVNERRYFTRATAPALLDDDVMDDYENHGGVRVDGGYGTRWSWTALGGAVDDGSDDLRGFGYAAVDWRSHYAQGALSYLAREDPGGEHAATLRGEVAGIYHRATLVVAYENTGIDDRAVFAPDLSFDWDGYRGGNFAESLPSTGAAFAEARLRGIAVRDRAHLDLFHRYHAVGPGFDATLSGATPGTVSNTTGLYLRHHTLALDGRIVYRKRVRWELDSRSSEAIETQARAFLKNGSEVVVRGVVGHRDEPGDVRTNDNFVHGALRRSMRKLDAGVHVMVKNIDDGDYERRFGVEARMNWSANIALYGRLIAADDEGSDDAVYCRLELRPARHVFATVGWGLAYVGDGPYLIEDDDIGGGGSVESVLTVTVRGDF